MIILQAEISLFKSFVSYFKAFYAHLRQFFAILKGLLLAKTSVFGVSNMSGKTPGFPRGVIF